MMNTDHLTCFLSVARHLNYTRAAKDLHLSQSAVWRQMRQLETDLGVRLFEQIGKQLHLSEAGRKLEREAQVLLGHLSRIEEGVRAHKEGVLGRLRIGASTTPGFYVLPSLLGAFHVQHPEVDLRFEIDNSAAIEQRLVRNELDVAFVGGDINQPELHSRQCLQDEIVCFTSPDHPLASRKRVSPDALRSELCVLREKGSATRQLFEGWIGKKNGLLERTMVIRCPEAQKTIVAAGIGFSFLSIHGIAHEVERGELVRLAVTGMRLRRPITMAWHKNKHVSATIQAFMDRVFDSLGTGGTALDDPALLGAWPTSPR